MDAQLSLFAVPKRARHPAKWTPAILATIAPTLRAWHLAVHDCFGGTGVELGRLCDALELVYTGTEIRTEFIVDRRVRHGDATDAATYPTHNHCVVTSPPYTNGIADNYARAGDRRHTYQQASTDALGYVPTPHPNDMGVLGAVRHGNRQAEADYWRIADVVACNWPRHVVVNVDAQTPMDGGAWYPLADRWRRLLVTHGYAVVEEIPVETPRQREGANAGRRAPHEMVIVAQREERKP